jgi:streptogramin lyase
MASAWSGLRRAAIAGGAIAALVSASGDGRSVVAHERAHVVALADVEVIASGFREPAAVAVEPGGAVLVADRAAGTVTRLDGDGGHEVLLPHLRRPNGLAVDGRGRIFVLELGARRIVRLDPDGTVEVVASALRQPRAIAASPDGRVWVAARREREEVIARVDPGGTLATIATGFVGVQGLAADDGSLYIAVAGLAGERGLRRTRVVRVAPRADGTAAVEPLLSGIRHRPAGVAVDVLGALYIGGVGLRDGERDEDHDHDDDDDADGDRDRTHRLSGGVILKWRGEGGVTTFARGLGHPLVLALAPGGDLLVAERRRRGRVLRFRAPSPPAVDVPEFTSETPVLLAGRSQPRDRVQLLRSDGGADPTAVTVADADGRFSLAVPLAANASTDLVFRATAVEGRGLTSAAAAAAVTHDDVLPNVFMLEPLAGVQIRQPVVLRARGEDDASGVATVSFLLDDALISSVANPGPPAPLLASAVLQPEGLAEGLHTLATVAVDRAGNQRAEAQLLVVDRTPPDTFIASAPGAETAERSVRFTVEGRDVWSPTLEFSWRLDSGAWSPFGASVIELTGLAPGPHRFEVKALDLAGNEDLTPAIYLFVVRSLRLRVLEPTDGATITSSSFWVRGTVDGGAGDVVVRVVPPPEFAGTIAGSVEGGSFAVEVPADPAFATLTMVAADASGATVQAAVSVVIAPDGSSAESLDVWPPGGVAPLDVRIALHGFSDVPLAIDLEGDGTDEFDGIVGADTFEAAYTRPGIYLPTVRVQMPNGDLLVRRGRVEVYDRAALDARLQAVWAGFRDALEQGDADAAASFILAERRAAWAEYFRALPADTFQAIDDLFPAIVFVEAGAGGAQYEMVAERGGLLFSYAVWFQLDADGRWRLWRF